MTYELYCGDCLQYTRTMPDKSVDAVITDPPYGVNINKSNRLSVSRGFGTDTWDTARNADAITKIMCLGLTTVIWGGNYYADLLPPTRGWLIWDKLNDKRDFGEAELAWTNIDMVIRRYRKFPVSMDGGKVHPTQKPIELMAWCIELASEVGDTIFDPFMGSGTTGVACMQLGRNFIGCEIDPGYYAIAEKRIKQAAAQMLLPLDQPRDE
jgi:site-specific DNA-methyltransferase (adenine-specific)